MTEQILVDTEDFNLEIWRDNRGIGYRCNIWIHGTKAVEYLKHFQFKDAKKEWKRKMIIEHYDNFTPLKQNMG